MLDDLNLLKNIKRGDIKAFEKVFKSYYRPLYLYASSITGRDDVAEEIVQDLFYVIWKGREKLHIFFSFKSYLYRAVRNQSLQYLKRAETENKYIENVIENSYEKHYSSPLDILEYRELERVVNLTLSSMPERRRNIFRMHRFEKKKYDEIAETYSISVKTVEAEMSKALRLLKKEVEKYTHASYHDIERR